MMSSVLRYVVIAALAGIFLGSPLSTFAADKWVSVRSRNFFLVGNGSEKTVRRVARDLESFREAFLKLFPKAQAAVSTNVVVFRTDESFKPYKLLYQGKPANISGFFQGGRDVNYIAMSEVLDSPRSIYSGYVHALTGDALAGVPTWVRVGVSQFYSTFSLQSEKKFNIGKPIEEHLRLLRERSLLPLATLFEAGYDSPILNEPNRQATFYAQSWALTHYLMLGPDKKRRQQFDVFLNLMASGKPAAQSFETAFQTTYALMEKELSQYIHGRVAWPFVGYELDNAMEIDRTMVARPISEAESLYYLGDMMAHIQRADFAREILAKAITLDPGLAGPHAALGMLAVRETEYAEAAGHLERAIKIDGENYLTQYYYARMLERKASEDGVALEDEALESVRTALKKSIRLNPAFAESASLFGYINLTRNQNHAETIELLQVALKVSPGRSDITVMLSDALVREQKFDEAKALLGPVIASNAVDKRVRDNAADILEYIERRGAVAEEIRPVPGVKADEDEEVASETPASAGKSASDEAPTIRRAARSAQETVLEEIPSGRPPSAGSSSETSIVRDSSSRPVGTEELRGSLTGLECGKGATLSISTGGKLVKLHTPDPSGLQFMSNTPAVKDELACGPLKKPLPVRVLYRPGSGPGASIGVPVLVEFVP